MFHRAIKSVHSGEYFLRSDVPTGIMNLSMSYYLQTVNSEMRPLQSIDPTLVGWLYRSVVSLSFYSTTVSRSREREREKKGVALSSQSKSWNRVVGSIALWFELEGKKIKLVYRTRRRCPKSHWKPRRPLLQIPKRVVSSLGLALARIFYGRSTAPLHLSTDYSTRPLYFLFAFFAFLPSFWIFFAF